MITVEESDAKAEWDPDGNGDQSKTEGVSENKVKSDSGFTSINPIVMNETPELHRVQAATLEDWEMQKSSLQMLYLIQNKSLEETRISMEQSHGFYASYGY